MIPIQHASAGAVCSVPPDSLRWTLAPPASIRRRRPIVAAIAAFAFLAAFALFHSLLFATGAVAVLVVPLVPVLAPLSYSLSPNGAKVQIGPIVWLEMPWQDVRSVACITDGLKLSAYHNPATAVLESRRGIALRYRAEQAAEVEAAVVRFRAARTREEAP